SVSEPVTESLEDLVTTVEANFILSDEDPASTSDDALMASLFGGPDTQVTGEPTPGGDRYNTLDHEALYQEVRKRSGDDIRAPALGVILREAVQRDKKVDSIYKFTDAM